ncbi:MAG: DUF1573 domain-containing protein [Planctomycetes bacterium]|nr:DUF1573 domain-containing protein [Planctomycetota bacterium]
MISRTPGVAFRRHFLTLFCLVAAVWSGITIARSMTAGRLVPLSTNGRSGNVQCGPECLWIAANLLGVPVAKDGFSSIPVDPQHGTTLGSLKRGAEAAGFDVRTGKFGWDELLKMKGCAVLWVNSNHFVVAEMSVRKSPDTGDLKIYDPARNGAGSWWSKEALLAVWTGESLVLDHRTNENSETTKPRMRMDRFWLDLGTVRDPEAVFQAEIRNQGRESLTVRVARSSCSCTSATITDQELEQGATGELRATVRMQGKRGPFLETVDLETNDPVVGSPKVILSGIAFYSGNLLSVGRAHLGSVLAGADMSGEFYVHDPGDRTLVVTEAIMDGGRESTSTGCRWNVITQKVGADSALIGKRGRFFVEPGDYHVRLEGKVPAGCPPGNWKYHLRVRTRGTPESEYVSEIAFTVLPDVQVSPASVVLSRNLRDCRIALSSRSKRTLQVAEAMVPDGVPVTIGELDSSDGQATVDVRLDTPNISHVEDFVIRLQLASGEQVNVPLILLPSNSEPATSGSPPRIPLPENHKLQ